MTRTENSKKNLITGLINQFLIILFRFITRTVLIKYLGEQYLGINGLFSNILSLLSLADLGIGTALIYSLYKPIVDEDYERQNTIIHYLKKVYFFIGIIILGLALILTPFITFVINDKVDFINIYIVFLMYAFQTASTYLFFASYSEFLNANQKNYIYTQTSNRLTIISNLIQVIVLVLFKNFYLYLSVIIIFGIIQSFIVSIKAKKMYPFIKETPKKTLTKKEKLDIFKDCGSLIIYRTNYVVLMATDNIVISKYLGLGLVGLYSNYILIVNSIVNVLQTFFFSIKAAIGNLHASDDKEKEYFMFKLINLLTIIIFGTFSVGVYCLANDFITIWIGEKYILSQTIVLVISINLFIEGHRQFLASYRSSYGLFRNAKFIPLAGSVLNVVLSVILAKKYGLIGVLLATTISNLVSFMWYDPYLIYKKEFHKNPLYYYLKNLGYFALFIFFGGICSAICSIITISGIIGFIIHGLICVIVPIITVTVIYYKTEYGKYLKYTILTNFLKKGTNQAK